MKVHMKVCQQDIDAAIGQEKAAYPGNKFLDQFDGTEINQVIRSIEWIQEHLRSTSRFRTLVTSYGYKHRVERQMPNIHYVSNASFIIAARITGIAMRPCDGGINRELKAVAK